MALSNFTFLLDEFADVFAEAKKAEEYVHAEPRFSAILCRTALEKMITWLYENDYDLEMPYENSLNSLMRNYEFKRLIDPHLFAEIDVVRRTGNKGAHGQKVSAYESLTSIKNCFRFFSWVSRYYSVKNPKTPDVFDESILPSKNKVSIPQKELDNYLKETEKARLDYTKILQKNEAALEENKLLRIKLEEQAKLIAERKAKREEEYNSAIPVAPLTSEAETRKQLIDLMLYEAGWTSLAKGYNIEYKVTGMPETTNKSGIGYVDYVLWGADGVPLAIIEAKSTLHDATVGQHQAKLYADAIEGMTGHRPIIYYTNGFEYYMWDDTFYPPRKVSGFYNKADLETLTKNRGKYMDLRKYPINKDIAGRAYQMQAIRSIAESFVTDSKDGVVGRSRKALLVMATGTGKTRTSAALVEMLMKYNWAKRVLFLADRNALVTQAKDAFKEHLPNLNAIDLTREKDDGSNARVVFSTYPTMLNRIDEVHENGEKVFGVGHFDLIIIDEAHRSVYQKYQAIFEYFDSLLIGLTATPVSHIDRNTFELFGLDTNDPTFAYDLDQAVRDGFLVSPKGLKVPVKFPREGIKYEDLSDADKDHYSELFGVPITNKEEFAKHLNISKSKINSILFNKNTVDIVLDTLMKYGQRVESGDKIGKTIIFAKNHKHAEFIKRRFDKNYGYDNGDFLQVIDNYNSKAADLIKNFCFDKGDDKNPQIAVSVDMMDTGIDAPRVLNLVFFKEVYSHTKYWQMIGRGTRLCPDVFGPGKDKEHFLIMDVCGNFEFFEERPDGLTPEPTLSLSELILRAQLNLIYLINSNPQSSDESRDFALKLTDELHGKTVALDERKYAVHRKLEIVKKYKERDNWALLNEVKINEVLKNLGPIIIYDLGAKVAAKQFDLMMYNLNVAILSSCKSQERIIENLKMTALKLESFMHQPFVRQREVIIKAIQSDDFWENISILKLEKIRKELRDIVYLLKDEKENPIYSNFVDELKGVEEYELIPSLSNDLRNYKKRMERVIRNNSNHLVIDKIYRNIPITRDELKSLEEFLTHKKFDIDKIESEYGTKSLGVFIRKILGVDIESAQKHFATFIEEENLNFQQMEFVKLLINYLNKNGVIDKKMLTQSPFTNINDSGIFGVFSDESKIFKLINLIDDFGNNLMGA